MSFDTSEIKGFLFEHMPLWICRLRIRIREIKYNIKYFWQRGKRGYSDLDVYSIDLWFVRIMSQMLRHFKTLRHTYPEGQGTVETMEDWQKVLSEMIACLENMDEDKVIAELEQTDSDVLGNTEKAERILEDNKNRFFELFKEYFYCLWD